MATDFGTVEDAFVDHNTLHMLRRYSCAEEPHISAPSVISSNDYGSAESTTEAPCGAQIEKCVALLQEVAEEWKQQNAYDERPGKELMQRQIETLHSVRTHYLDEIVYYLERVQQQAAQTAAAEE